MALADNSLKKPGTSSTLLHGRPAVKRVRHTWHGEMAYRSHFEDFMLEIGVDARQHHLCCLPRQATIYTRGRTKSESSVSAVRGAGPSMTSDQHDGDDDKQPSPTKVSGPRRDWEQLSVPRSPFTHPLARPSAVSSKKVSGPIVKLKAQAATAVYTQNHGAFSQYPPVPAARGLRFLMGDSMVTKSSRTPSKPGFPVDQEPWNPLPNAPALMQAERPSAKPPPTLPTRRFSRAPSFASLETVSSSEGPETPQGHSPLPSPAHELSPSLSYLEHVSKIRVPALCVTCQKAGHNFPSCPSCGDTWCSRECRVKGSRDKKHVCQKVVNPPMVRPDSRGRHLA